MELFGREIPSDYAIISVSKEKTGTLDGAYIS